MELVCLPRVRELLKNTMAAAEVQTLSRLHRGSQRRSSSQTDPIRVRSGAQGSPWILDRWRDLLLFVGTPALLIPVFAAAQVKWSAQDIFLFVGAFGAMGHHLPGMIRAYGDPMLFRRFKTRFLVAPILLLGVCVWSSFYNVQAIQLVALAWGIWHGMMQTYGFCRIYDSKAGGKSTLRARADFSLCFAWFLAAVLLSPLRFRSCLDLYYDSGGPLLSVALISGIRIAGITAVAAVTIFFFWRQWRDAATGRGFSAIKLVLLSSSIGFWWYCNNGVQNILVGIALFEVFHDVQYLSIVWIYNRTRVERDETIKGFMRFVFRRSGALIGVYVGLVVAYGAISLTTYGVSADWICHCLVGLVTASALLHFYYDGFIWKVRESQTGATLGISNPGSALTRKRIRFSLPTVHALRWAALVIPFGILCVAQLQGHLAPALDRTSKVAEVLPKDAQAQLNYAKALHQSGRVGEAIERYAAALQLNPNLQEAEMFLGLAYSDSGDFDQSVAHYEKSLVLNPKDAQAECNLGSVLVLQGRRNEARRHFEHSLSVSPGLSLAHKELADLLLADGELDSAIAHYDEAIRLRPDFEEAKQNLRFARLVK